MNNRSRVFVLVCAAAVGLAGCRRDDRAPQDGQAGGDGPAVAGPEERGAGGTGTNAGGERGGPRVEQIVKESGLIIEDLKTGDGDLCRSARDTVTVHYRGTLENGKEFDSSYGGKPVKFPLNQLIEGWKEGIPGMKVGGKRRLTVPWKLAYGERAVRDDAGDVLIPAKSNLIFEIELVDVESK